MTEKSKKRSAQRGFSLVELLVVIVILGVLSAIVAVNVLPAGDQAKVQAAETQIAAIDSALRQYKLDMGNFPSDDEGIEALITVPPNHRNASSYRPGGYLTKASLPVDPWGNPYQYAAPGSLSAGVMVWSDGPDGRAGTGDEVDNQ